MLLTDTDGLYTADPRIDPPPQLVDEVTDYDGARRRCEIGHAASPLGSGGMRSQGRRGRDGDRGGDHRRDRAAGSSRASLRARVGGRAGRARASRRRRCATRASSCGSSTPSRATARVVVDAGAARALREGGTSLLPVGHRRRRRRASTRATPSRSAGPTRAAIGKGISQLLGRRAAPRDGPEVGRGARADAARDRGGRPPRLLRPR